ncbi:MAG: glutathione S-transferase family protein, partial [Alphaproteobacteria bacterium]|nr:glutathione S-transferase family protein [Alphaproteobacteria bacterium]
MPGFHHLAQKIDSGLRGRRVARNDAERLIGITAHRRHPSTVGSSQSVACCNQPHYSPSVVFCNRHGCRSFFTPPREIRAMMTLYNHPISPYARRVRVLAAELGLPLKLIDLDFAKGEQRSPDYLAKNPNGRVPVLEHDGRHLWESAAILYELAGEHPQAGLVPGGLAERADMLRWMFWGATHFEPPGRGITFELLVKPRLL